MPNVRLNKSRIEALRPRKSPYDVRDTELKGFGVRVQPSGAKRFFVHSQHEGHRLWKTTGDAGGMDLKEARRQAAEMLAAMRRDETPALPEDRLFDVNRRSKLTPDRRRRLTPVEVVPVVNRRAPRGSA